MARVGLISDTHGLLRPEAVEALRGCDYLVHAGDVGRAGILEELGALAPVTAVRGNVDAGGWAELLRDTETLRVGEVALFVLHDIAQLDLDPAAAGIRAVVFGHSHHPVVEERSGVLFINPGSAGPRRFKLPITVAVLLVSGTSVSARIVELRCATR